MDEILYCVSVVLDGVLKDLNSSARLTMSLFLGSSGSNVQGVSRALDGHPVSSKSLSRIWDEAEGVAMRNKREKYHAVVEVSLIWPSGKSKIFSYLALTNIRERNRWKTEFVTTPVCWSQEYKPNVDSFWPFSWRAWQLSKIKEHSYHFFCLVAHTTFSFKVC